MSACERGTGRAEARSDGTREPVADAAAAHCGTPQTDSMCMRTAGRRRGASPQEAHALEQRVPQRACLLNDAGVEGQPAELAVDEAWNRGVADLHERWFHRCRLVDGSVRRGAAARTREHQPDAAQQPRHLFVFARDRDKEYWLHIQHPRTRREDESRVFFAAGGVRPGRERTKNRRRRSSGRGDGLCRPQCPCN